jgi:hypothetical protein
MRQDGRVFVETFTDDRLAEHRFAPVATLRPVA